MTHDEWRTIEARLIADGHGMIGDRINAAWQRARATGTSRDDPAEVVEAAVRKELEAAP